MNKLHMLTAAGGILLALASPTLAAQRSHHAADAYASEDRSGAYNYGPVYGQSYGGNEALTPHQHSFMTGYGQNLPYPDRPYGDPDRD